MSHKIITSTQNNKYREGWNRIFGKRKQVKEIRPIDRPIFNNFVMSEGQRIGLETFEEIERSENNERFTEDKEVHMPN